MLWSISSAISSTERSPCASRSTISARRPLANALATSASPSNNASFAARSPMERIVDPTGRLVKSSFDNLTKMPGAPETSEVTKETAKAQRTSLAVECVLDEGLGHSSYLVGLGDGSALVVDPARFPDRQRQLAAERNWRVA